MSFIDLDPLFYPSSIALVGASQDERKSGGIFLKSLLDLGYQGRLYLVNSRASEIRSLKVYASLLEMPEGVDLAILTVPAPAVPSVMEECAQKGVKFAFVHAAGFAELGPQGRHLEERMLAVAQRGGLRVIGPNCMGIFSPEARINTITSSGPISCEPGPVAFFGQSGWASEEFIIGGQARGLRFSKVVSSGNQNGLDGVDYLSYFGSDPRTEVIACYQEGMARGREFVTLARDVTRRKPVLLWKGGKTRAGARAMLSHTGSLATSQAVTLTALKQAGVVLADHLEELIDFAVAFSAPCWPQGRRMGVLVDSGGGAVSLADAAEASGLELPALPEDIQEELRRLLTGIVPPFSGISNPVDLVWPQREHYARLFPRCLEAMAPVVDGMLVFSYCPFSDDPFIQGLTQVQERTGKPIFLISPYPSREVQGMSYSTRRGVAAFPTPERAARAMAALAGYAGYRREVSSG